MKPTTRCAATSKPDVLKICEPMCEWMPDQAQLGARADRQNRLARGTGGQGQPELLVLVGGRDELVGVRLDAGGDPDEHVGDDTGRRRPRSARRSTSSRESMHEAADPRGQRRRAARPRTCCCRAGVIRSAGNPAAQRQRQLATGADVQAEALLGQPPHRGGAQEGLAREGHRARDIAVGVGRLERRSARPEVRLVEDQRRGAVLGGEVADRASRRSRACRWRHGGRLPARSAGRSGRGRPGPGRSGWRRPGRTSPCIGPAGCARMAAILGRRRQP